MRLSGLGAGRALLAAVATLLLALPAPTAGASDSPAALDRAASTLQSELDAVGIPGGAVAVVSDGRVGATGVGGTGDGRTTTADTPFVIGSATKSFTALAVMQLVDAGRVDLDAPVRRYVPELELSPGEPVDAITVRHLLHHTSGLDDLAGGPLLASAADGTPLDTVAELDQARLVSAPGRHWRYANVNYVLAGLVVERASGLAYGDYVEQRIFEPLQMTDSHAAPTSTPADELSRGHRFWFGWPVATEPVRREATLAAGYLVSTAEDLGRYLAMLISGGVSADGTRVVSAEGLDLMLTPAADATLGPWADGQASSYAMGWFRGGPWGDDIVFHPGNTPDTTTLLLIAPAQGTAVATVVNAGHEMPVPGNPAITDRVTRNVAHAALDQPIVDLPSLQRFYLGFDIAAALLVGAAMMGVVRAVRAARRPRPSHRTRRWVGVVLRSLLAAALVLLPASSVGWGGLWTWAPDLAVVIALLAACLTLTAGLRLIELLRAIGGTPSPSPPPTPARDAATAAARS
ncbi:serine hydrolase [Nostocoides sp. F2B08]|uniref:serine hydrolase domain-containing protein n=1 Tax=Nostocoides sp. F2B08 TaxID=2653936 RepID=UPI001263C2F7|nr:serine hydrolase domain-containing protein [Tetrasphaera sp. F2B08]KAB7743301.1 serine hydrolase [Tetrasphaera sp. F2B08]